MMQSSAETGAAVGPQPESMSRSAPVWTIGKETRDTAKKIYISSKHKADTLGKVSPGPVYTPMDHASRLTQPCYSFGNARSRPRVADAKYPETSADLLCTPPPVKTYPTITASIGTCPREAPSLKPDLDSYPPGAISPGPLRYNLANAPFCHRFPWAKNVDQNAPQYTMRPNTKIFEHESQTPQKVGPGIYKIPPAVGPQVSSEISTQPTFSFGKGDRFGNKKNQRDTGRLWDGMGDKSLTFKRSFSSPSFGFGTSTRAGRGRVAPALTDMDKGPVANLGSTAQRHPKIDLQKELKKFAPGDARP